MFNISKYINRRAVVGSLAVAVLMLASAGCKRSEPAVEQNYLVKVGNRTLTHADLARITPAGLTPDDSVKFVKAYVNRWIDEALVSEIASESVDIDRINRLTDDYRRELIMREYTEKMFRQHAGSLPEDSLRAYYETHKDMFRLSQPMVRGTYIKIDSEARNLKTIRRLYASDKIEDADKLEKELLSDAIHYDYFRDQWIPWEQIESRIPYEFGPNSHSWPAKGRKLDFTQGGNTYLLYISEYLSPGDTAPFQAVQTDIVTRMLNANRSAYQTNLLRELLQQAKDTHRATINL